MVRPIASSSPVLARRIVVTVRAIAVSVPVFGHKTLAAVSARTARAKALLLVAELAGPARMAFAGVREAAVGQRALGMLSAKAVSAKVPRLLAVDAFVRGLARAGIVAVVVPTRGSIQARIRLASVGVPLAIVSRVSRVAVAGVRVRTGDARAISTRIGRASILFAVTKFAREFIQTLALEPVFQVHASRGSG